MGEREGREHFLPLSSRELIELLCADRTLPEAEREDFRRFGELVLASAHFEFNRRLGELKAAYAPFDPDADSPPLIPLSSEQRQHRLNDLVCDFGWLMERANFKHLSREEIEPALATSSDWGIRMDVDFSAFEHIAIFARGACLQKRTRRRLRKLYRQEETEVPIYRRLVIILKLRQHPRLPANVDTENVYLKIFKDIPQLDVMMLLPGARVRFTNLDRGWIGLPLMSGAAMAFWNVVQDLWHNIETWGVAAGGIGYGYKCYYGYRQTKQRYHLTLTQSLYFQNLDSNAGVLTRLFDEAEEQECRVALLAYYCLWRYAPEAGWTAADLENSMDLYLDRYADLAVRCDGSVALEALQKQRVVEKTGDRWRALPLARALDALHAAWDKYFPRLLAEADRAAQS
jgi:hypothetical protein